MKIQLTFSFQVVPHATACPGRVLLTCSEVNIANLAHTTFVFNFPTASVATSKCGQITAPMAHSTRLFWQCEVAIRYDDVIRRM